MKKIIITMVVLIYALQTVAFAEEQSLNLTIDETTHINTVKRELFGFNYEWGDDVNAGFYVNEDTTENYDFYKQLKGYPFVNNRAAGVTSGTFLWKYSIGPLSNRIAYDDSYTPSSRTNSGKPVKRICGLNDWLRGMKGVDNTARYSYVVNVLNDSIENVADVVEYLRGDGTVNYNGGVNWAMERIGYGIKEPVDIVVWEIGNELDLRGITYEQYINLAKQAISAIRSVDKETPIAMHIATSDVGSVGTDWQRRLILEMGDYIDYLVFHKYYGYKSVSGVLERTLINLIKDINEFSGDDRLKVIITEHASAWISNQSEWPYNHSIAGMLNEVDFFSRIVHYPQVVSANYHGFRTGPWNMCYKDSDGIIKPTILLDLYKIFVDNAVGKDVIKTELEGFNLGQTTDIPGFAVIDETGEICVFLGNFKEKEAVKINLNMNSDYTLKELITIEGNGDIYANNYIDRKEIAITSTKYNDGEICENYSLNPLSFAMLRLAPVNK